MAPDAELLELGSRFLHLPLDVQLLILQYLRGETLQTMLTEVPHLYQKITLDKTLWSHIKLDGMKLPTGRACKLLMKAPHYTQVNISNRTDLNKLLKVLCQSPRVSHITHLTLTDCLGSDSPQRPLVRAVLLLRLLTLLPALCCLELRLHHPPCLPLFQTLGRLCFGLQMLASSASRQELIRFLCHAPTHMFTLLEDSSVQGSVLVERVTDSCLSFGRFMVLAREGSFTFCYTSIDSPS